ncbi:MAG: fumarate hydratase [Clostridiaceae bacterium]|nr:fumarate hydratase [Clostridiaceae bacterium]
MREIDAKIITDKVAKLCIKANQRLGTDVEDAIKNSINRETNVGAKDVLEKLLENLTVARQKQMPICQDTGMVVVFFSIGQNVYVRGSIEKAINEGVRIGYEKGYLRKSVVSDPLTRKNTGDNTPAVIHYDITDDEKIRIDVVPKGFGSENMSAIKMLNPSDGRTGVIDFVVDTVKKAASNPCPPIVVGVGIGGTFEKAALLSKKALLLPVDSKNKDIYYAELEKILTNKINDLSIGAMGWGGDTTTLGVNVLTYPTHIAGLAVAVNISCHVTRHASVVI